MVVAVGRGGGRGVTIDRAGRALRVLRSLDPAGGETVTKLCTVCVDALGVSGACLTVSIDGADPVPLCSSDALAARVAELQHTLGEGPSVDASRTGVPVSEDNLANPHTARWPAFGAAAASAGAAALFAFPLRMGAVRLGVLTLHQIHPGRLRDDQFVDALLIAQMSTSHVLATQAGAPPGLLAEDLEMLASQRAEVHQATGMVSVQLGVDAVEALVRLRAFAFANDRSLADVGADVVARRLRFT